MTKVFCDILFLHFNVVVNFSQKTLLLEILKLQTAVKTSLKRRSSHQRCSMRKGVLRNFTKFAGKHLCQTLFFNKVTGLRPATLLKKILWHRCLPVNFAIFLRTPFLQSTSGRLHLYKIVWRI